MAANNELRQGSTASAMPINGEQQTQYVWRARMNCGKTILKLLKMINDVHEMAVVSVSDDGVRVTVEKHKVVQGSVFFEKTFFDSYELKGNCVSFRIDLKLLIDCIGIFGYHHMPGGDHMSHRFQAMQLTSTTSRSQLDALLDQMVPFKLKLAYRDQGFPLELVVDESEADSVCNLETYPSDTLCLFEMHPNDTVVEILISSEFLFDLLSDLDFTSDFVRLTFYKETHKMKIATKSSLGSVATVVNNMDAHDDVDRCDIDENQKNVYKLSLFKYSMKPMEGAEFTVIRVSRQGLLCFSSNIAVEVTDGKDDKAFVDHFFVPCLPDEW